MKKVIKAKTEQKTFRIYYKDGNQKLFGGDNIYEVLSYVLFEQGDNAEDIYKIEEIEDKSVSAASYILKDLNGNHYFSKHSTGKAWTDYKDEADRFESREDVIDFGNKYFEGTYLYGKDWAEVPVTASNETKNYAYTTRRDQINFEEDEVWSIKFYKAGNELDYLREVYVLARTYIGAKRKADELCEAWGYDPELCIVDYTYENKDWLTRYHYEFNEGYTVYWE